MIQPPYPAPTAPRYRFGAFELRPASRELLCDGRLLDAQPKVLDLIAYLVEHRHRAVDKQELMDAVWPRQVVTDAALSRCVMKARRALDDSAEQPRFIRTVHGHGFQFVADVVLEIGAPDASDDSSAVHSSDDATPVAMPARRPWRGIGLWSAAIIAILGGAFAWLAVNERTSLPPGAIRLAVLPVENATGDAAFDWVPLGLMATMADALREGELPVDVLDARDTLGVLGSAPVADPQASLQSLGRAHGVTHALAVRVERAGGVLRFHSQLLGESMSRRRSFVGNDVLELARGAVQDTAAVLGSTSPDRQSSGWRRVVNDPLAHEAYVRGLAMFLQGRAGDALPFMKLAHESDNTAFWPAIGYARALAVTGSGDEAAPILERLLETALAEGDEIAESIARSTLANLLHRRGQLEQAHAHLLRAVEIARAHARHDTVMGYLGALTQIAILRHRYDEAGDYLRQAERVQTEHRGDRPDYYLLERRGVIALHDLRLDQAGDALAQALEIGKRQGSRIMIGWAAFYLAEVAERDGRMEDALTFATTATEAFEHAGERNGLLGALRQQAVLASRLGRADATHALPRLRELAGERPAEQAMLADAEAWLAYERGDFAAAVAAWRRSPPAGVAHATARHFLQAARAALAARDADAARAFLHAAAESTPADGEAERIVIELAEAVLAGHWPDVGRASTAGDCGLAWDIAAFGAIQRGASTTLRAPDERCAAGYPALLAARDASADTALADALDRALQPLRGDRPALRQTVAR